MSNRRQNLQYLSPGTIVLYFCVVAFFMSASLAFSMGSGSESLLSSCGLTAQQFEKKAKEYLGVPYQRGGTSKKGMDCSGFARTLYDRIFSIELPHSSVEQYQSSDLRKISKKRLQPGDLIFFSDKRKKRINHVGVYLSNGKFIHASSSLGITVSKLSESYWQKRFVGSKRHQAQSSGPGPRQAEVESSIEIPVHENGTITGYAHNEMGSASAAFQDDESDTFAGLYNASALDSRYLSFYQIGYDHWIANSLTVNISAFQEIFDISTAWPGLEPYSRTAGSWQEGFSSDTALRNGFQLATDIHPSNWLSITPFITFFDNYSGIQENWDVPKRTFGLNSLVTPGHGRWTLSMLLQYSDQQDLVNTANIDNMISSLDLSVKLGLHLTENLQVSLTGKHDIRTAAYDSVEDTSSAQISSNDVFFSFDLTY